MNEKSLYGLKKAAQKDPTKAIEFIREWNRAGKSWGPEEALIALSSLSDDIWGDLARFREWARSFCYCSRSLTKLTRQQVPLFTKEYLLYNRDMTWFLSNCRWRGHE